MRDTLLIEEQPSLGRFVVPALALSNAVAFPAGLLVNLLLIDIGEEFSRSVGSVGQLQTVASIVAAVTALAVGVLSVRFSQKLILQIGLVFFCISAVACAVSSNFAMLFLFYAITGLGMAMIQPMVFALVGTYLPLEKRPSALGWVNASIGISWVVGVPIIGYIAVLGSWRWAFLVVVLPVSLLGLLMATRGLPPVQRPRLPESPGAYLAGFREVFNSRSALACLVGTALMLAGGFGLQVYVASFVRDRFQISTELTSILFAGGSLVYALGTLIVGRFVLRFGKKPITGLTGGITSISLIILTNISSLWLVVMFWYFSAFFFGMAITTAYSLTLEQVPKFRGFYDVDQFSSRKCRLSARRWRRWVSVRRVGL